MKKTLLSAIFTATVALATNAQNVNIPDANFKAYLVGNSAINTNADTEIQVSEAVVFNGTIDCNSQNISNLTGIEAFAALTNLTCHSNQLTTLDVSTNTALTVLDCGNNQLTSLDVSNNTGLTILGCLNNQLTSLDVSNNTALTILVLTSNQLTSLDVSNNTALTTLNCGNNQLPSLNLSTNTSLTTFACDNNQFTFLNMSNHTSLTQLVCSGNLLTTLNLQNGNNTNFTYLYAINNPNLTCIEVDNAAYSTANWTNIDATASFSEDCSTVGIADHTIDKTLMVYPNPVKDIINFSVQTNAQLLSVAGEIITEKKNATTFDFSNHPSGIYFLTLTDNNGQVIQRNKIVKE